MRNKIFLAILVAVMVLLALAGRAPINLREWYYVWALDKRGETCNILNIQNADRPTFRKFINTWGNYEFVLKRNKESKKISYQELNEGLANIPLKLPFP